MSTRDYDRELSDLGLSIECQFTGPKFSGKGAEPKQRGRAVDYQLTWDVTLKIGGLDVLTTPFRSGRAIAPHYKKSRVKSDYIDHELILWHEVSTGKSAGKKIEPSLASFVSCIVLDSCVIDYASLEDWAHDFGYSDDSREAERIYRACLDVALKLRAGLGDKLIAHIREILADY